ncbi:MAG: hypothetical protein ACHQ1H_14140, partial [Nitrososphaerales archaeon]
MTSVVAERESQPLPPEPQTSENYGELRVVLQALRMNRTAFASVILIAVVIIGAVFAPLIAPYDPLAQNLVLRFQPPS